MTQETEQTGGRMSRRTLLASCFSGTSVFLIITLYALANAEGLPDEYASVAGVLLCLVAFPAILLVMLLASVGSMFFWPDSILDIEVVLFLVVPSTSFWGLAGSLIGRIIDKRKADVGTGLDESG